MQKDILLVLIISLSWLGHTDSLESTTHGQPRYPTEAVSGSTVGENGTTVNVDTTGTSTTKPELTTDGSRVLGFNPLRILFGRIPPLAPVDPVTTTQLPTVKSYTTVVDNRTTRKNDNAQQSNVSDSTTNSVVTITVMNVTEDDSETTSAQTTTGKTEQSSYTQISSHSTVTETSLASRTTISSQQELNTGNATDEQHFGYYYVLCGYPAICNTEKCSKLEKSRDPISECARQGSQEIFGIAIVFMAIMIIGGNCLLPIIVLRNRDMRTHHNIMKVSLAFADMLMGFILLFSALPNMAWTLGSAEFELVRKIEQSKNSATAVVAGSVITLSALASLGHLMYLSIERFVAIQWPLWHRGRRTRTIVLQILALWAVAVLASFIPAAFPEEFQYTYNHVMFVYLVTPVGESNVSRTWFIVLAMIVPFAITVLSTILTGFIVWYRLRNTEQMKSYSAYRKKMNLQIASPTQSSIDSTDHNKNQHSQFSRKNSEKIRLKPEVAVFRTTVLMIVAFCLTILPIIVVLMLYYNDYYDCDNYSVPYTCSFYACILNSFVNVIIYTIRDRKFRAGLSALVHCKSRISRKKPPGKNLTVTTNLAAYKASTRF